MRRVLLLLVVLLLILPSYARILGVFQGTVISLPAAKAQSQWLTVQSKNGHIRRVEITKAVFTYDEDYPESDKRDPARRSVCQATEVVVTAEKEKSKKGDGAWLATEVMILKPKAEPGKLVRAEADEAYCLE